MPDQLQDIVSRMVAAGESEQDIALVIQQMSHQQETTPKRPEDILSASDPDYMGGDPDLGRRGLERLPAIAAGAAAAGSGGGVVLPAIAAGGAGYLGARLRGDSRGDAAWTGAGQGALQLATGGTAKLLKAVAGPIYRAAIPKAIQDKFASADLVGEGLRNRIGLGTKQGTEAAERAGTTAAQKITNAAPSVRPMAATDVETAFAPKRATAVLGRKAGRVSEIDAHVKQAMDEIGPTPMSGEAQLARKGILEPESKAAMGAPNPNMTAVNPQLANIERKALVKNLRASPPMASALNESQAAVGLTRAAKATENSSVINRLSHGGVWNAAKSPMALSHGAIGMNELANIPFDQLLRLAQIAQLNGGQQ